MRGRSSTLTVNYRTSHQIRRTADHLLPDMIRDVDGNADERGRTVSVFNGPQPEVKVCASVVEECASVAEWIGRAREMGEVPAEIGVFVRSRAELLRARDAVERAGLSWFELSDREQEGAGRVAIGTMHLAKGLEFKAVVVMACDDGVIPARSRLETAADEAELDDAYQTERHLLYVACTRARDRLLISAVTPASEFLLDLGGVSPGAAVAAESI